MMMYFTQYDIEYIILFTVLGILFVGSLHRKDFLTIGGVTRHYSPWTCRCLQP